MSEKKPAHRVIVEMMGETVGSLIADLNDPNPNCEAPEVESISVLLKVGILTSNLEMLKRMIIPQKEVGWVVSEIRQTRAKLPSEYAEKLLPEKFILAISPSE